MSYIILYISLSIFISFLIYKKTHGIIENFIPYRIILTDRALNPPEFILDKETSFIDDNISKCIQSFYPLKIVKKENIIQYINSNSNSLGICYKYEVNKLFLEKKIKNVTLLHDLYYEYLCIISPKSSGIFQYNQIRNENPVVYILNRQFSIVSKIVKILLPNIIIKQVSSILDLNKNKEKYILFILIPELSNLIDEFAKNNKFLILDFPKENDLYKILFIGDLDTKFDKMNISYIKTINVNKVVNTLKFAKCIIVNKDANINNLIESIYERFEYIRLYNSSNYYRIPMTSFVPEITLKLNIIPLHKHFNNYLRELGIIITNDNPICKNTISTIKCNPDILWENRFKLLGMN